MDDIFGNVTSHNIIAERILLGSLIAGVNAVKVIGEDNLVVNLSVNDFALSEHRRIFDAMSKIIDREEHLDVITLTAELAKLGYLNEIGNATYLNEILKETFTIEDSKQINHEVVFALKRILKNAYLKRRKRMKNYLVELEITKKYTASVVVTKEGFEGNDNSSIINSAKEKAESMSHDSWGYIDTEMEVNCTKLLPSELSNNHITLLECGYSLKKVLSYTEEEAEAELDAISMN